MATIVLLHGIPGSSAIWSAVADRLRARHDVLTPDLLGFGRAPSGEGVDGLLAPAQARYVLGRLDAAGVDRFALVGHDFGGPVAAHLWADAPSRITHLGILATNAFPDTPVPFPLSTVRLPGVGAAVERILFSRSALGLLVTAGVGRPRPDVDLADYLGDRRQSEAIRTIFAQSLRRIGELYVPVRDALASVDRPAFVGWGDRDFLFPLEVGRRTAELIPGARFVRYAEAGHFLPAERPAEVAADIEALLAD